MIVDKYKIIGINIPRTASSARARLLAGYTDRPVRDADVLLRQDHYSRIPKHATAFQHLRKEPAKFLRYYKFSFVRNPWDRMVSFYRYRSKRFGADDFERYIVMNEFGDLDRQQLDYLFFKGIKLVNFVGRFENLYEDFNDMCKHIGFPHRLKCKSRVLEADYTVFYTDRTRQIVAKSFKKDIASFGYQFGGRS